MGNRSYSEHAAAFSQPAPLTALRVLCLNRRSSDTDLRAGFKRMDSFPLSRIFTLTNAS